MPYVNEYISPQDAAKYRLAEIDAKYRSGGISGQWTVDHERDIHLRLMARGREPETKHESLWSFYWRGALLTLQMELLKVTAEPGGPAWLHWRLVRLNGSNGMPPALKKNQAEILEDLHTALVAHGDGGVFSISSECSVTLDFGDECVL